MFPCPECMKLHPDDYDRQYIMFIETHFSTPESVNLIATTREEGDDLNELKARTRGIHEDTCAHRSLEGCIVSYYREEIESAIRRRG